MSDSARFIIAGKPLGCRHCGNDSFTRHRARIEDLTASGWDRFRNVDGRSVEIFRCTDCGLCHEFIDPPSVSEVSKPEPCLNCDETIPAGADVCPKCGWTWKAKPVAG